MPRMRAAFRGPRPWTASGLRGAGKHSGWRSTSSDGVAPRGRLRYRKRSPTRSSISRRPSDGWSGSPSGGVALNFVERHNLWSDEQKEAARRIERIVKEQNLEVIRLSFPDQHGIL